MKHIILILICAVSVFQTAWAKQQANIRGRVVSQEQQPVQGGSVYLLTPSSKVILKTTVSDEKGEFIFTDIPNGQYIVEVSAIGYGKATSELFSVEGKSILLKDFILIPYSKEIDAVTVRGELPLIQSSNGKLVLNVENSSIAAGNNALEVIKRAPGVSVDKDDNLTLMGQAGVNVTIDGRQTYMSSEQLSTFLKSTDGNQIKSVEVSTTRSAKDDAEGAVGTINITMKKNRIEGFNGTFIASGAKGNFYRGNSSLNLNYKTGNTTLFGNYSYTNNKKREDLDLERTIENDGVNTVFDQRTGLSEVDKTHNYKAGIEQRTSSRNVFVVQFTCNNNVEDSENNSITYMGRTVSAIDSIMTTLSPSDNKFNRYSFNANNEFKIDTTGKKLTADIDYSFFRTGNNTNYGYSTYFEDHSTLKYPQEHERSDANTKIDILAVKLDYTQPIWKGILETGLKYSNVSSDNDIFFEKQENDNSWSNIVNRTNTFLYTEQIAAGYLDYSTNVGKWGIKAGLRGEYTLSDGNSVSLDSTVSRKYFDLFPSASLSYSAHENHVLSLSYAKKISRPNYRFLNPFEYYIDKRTFMKGNTALNPQYTHGFTLNYTLYKMFNVTLGHDMTYDAIVESMGQNSEEKTSWVIRENLGESSTSYLNLSLPARIGKFWSMYNNLTGIYMHFKGPIAGYYVNDGSFFFQGSSMNTFKVNKNLSAELILNYNSPFVYNVYRIHSRFNTDIGATYSFKDQKSSLKLAVTDVFRSNHNNLNTDFEEYNATIRQYRDSQTVRLTYTYKFGNLKQSFNRREAKSEEKDRAMQ